MPLLARVAAFFVPICASRFVTFAEDNFRTFPTGKGIVFRITTQTQV